MPKQSPKANAAHTRHRIISAGSERLQTRRSNMNANRYTEAHEVHTKRAAHMSDAAIDAYCEVLEATRADEDTPMLTLIHGCYLSEMVDRRNRSHPMYNGWHEQATR